MATKLFLRNTTTNGITGAGVIYYDMLTTAGSSADSDSVVTQASGTEIQWTQTVVDNVEIQWISGRAPSGGFTLTSTDISIWAIENNADANCGGRYRVFKRAADGTETELGGGPFSDGVEFTGSFAEYTWTGNVTDTAFAEDDRILLKIYITNIGTMGGGRSCTLGFNAANAAVGDSFFNIAETVAFKAEGGATHATSGALTGPGSTIAGTAARTRQHASTGALAGPGSTIAGTAAHVAVHAAEGALVGQSAEISGAAELPAAAPPAVVAQAGGPGWNLFHPTSKRKKRVEDVERDIRQAYARANGEPDPYAQKEAIRDVKHAAAKALNIAKAEEDRVLFDLARAIIDMRHMRDMEAYLSRVGELLRIEAEEEDDMAAFLMIARLA